MNNARRWGLFGVLSLSLIVFWFGPVAFQLGDNGRLLWLIVPSIGGPLVASVLCFVAARRSTAGDVTAWTMFGIGSFLYLSGNLWYVFHGVAGIPLEFPTLPEAAFFLMAFFFAFGMAKYGRIGQRIEPVHYYNFLLIYGAVTVGCLLALHAPIGNSVLGHFPTIVAFTYPALWFSVAAFGAISLVLYDLQERSFPFVLLLLAIATEAAADFYYAVALMDGSYQQGGVTQLLWVASAGLLCWAAVEQIVLAPAQAASMAQPRSNARGAIQAVVPAAALGMILLAGSLSGAFGDGHYQVLSGVLAVGLAIVVALRERTIIETKQSLDAAVKASGAGLEESQRQLAAVLESTSDSVIVLDLQGHVVFSNDGALQLMQELGTLGPEGNLGAVLLSQAPARYEDIFGKVVTTQQPLELEFFSEPAGKWFNLRAFPSPTGLSLFFQDVSEPHRVREEMRHQAYHDSLTGLANRLLFQQRLESALESGKPVAVLLLDLDNFKEINDTLGHPIGDALLVGIAERLARCIGPSDTVARLGGDEFGIIQEDRTEPGDVERLAARILAQSSIPHVLDGHSIDVAASVGISLSQGSDDAVELFKKADIALYVAKAEATSAYRIFEPMMEQGLQARQALRVDLASALEKREFEVFYQPVVDLHSGAVSGFEALLRWHHPVRGMVPPDAFIAAAEESGLIVPIGTWVLGAACLEAMNWPDTISVAVNLSTRQFGAGDLLTCVSDALRISGLAAGRLELEITESVLLQDSKANLQTLEQLRAMGIRVALDDFGTGYSSLAYLQKFQFSKVKIDKSFIGGLPDREESRAIVTAVVGLGNSLGMQVTAEGVETEAQYDWVRRGCSEAQGFLLGRPVPAADIPPMLARLNFRRLAARAYPKQHEPSPSSEADLPHAVVS